MQMIHHLALSLSMKNIHIQVTYSHIESLHSLRSALTKYVAREFDEPGSVSYTTEFEGKQPLLQRLILFPEFHDLLLQCLDMMNRNRILQLLCLPNFHEFHCQKKRDSCSKIRTSQSQGTKRRRIIQTVPKKTITLQKL